MKKLLVCLSCFVTALLAQQGTTSLRGTVTDPSGLAIPSATVLLENKSRGFRQTITSNAEGAYELLQIQPATYDLTISAPGFKTVLQSNLALQVSTPATVNVKLEIAATAETVTVAANSGPVINSTDATIGNAFDSKQILAIPSEGRNPVELLSLQPGVSYVGNQVDTDGDSRGGAVNGARSDQSNVTVDGLDNNDQLLGKAFTGVLRIPSDSIEEFRVTTTNSNADSGRSSGAQVALVTKTGTNNLHGDAYEYNRSLIGAANDWFNKHAQLNTSNPQPNKPGKLIRNTFGAAAGGPILKNRLFFFANYEGQRSRETTQVTQGVPSANLRKGIVSYLCDPGNDANCALDNPNLQITRPASFDPQNPRYLVTLQPSQFAALDQGCLSSGTCPLGNGVSQAVLNVWNGRGKLPNGQAIPAYPLPNTTSAAGADGYNILGYSFAAPQPTDQNTFLAKLDYNITQNGNHRIFLRGGLQRDRTAFAPQFPGQAPSVIDRDNSKGLFAGYTAVFTNSLINNFRYGFTRQSLGSSGQNPYAQVSFWNMADPVSFNRTTNVNVPVHQFADDMTWTHGKHAPQFGGNWRIVNNNRYSDAQNYFSGSMHPTWFSQGGIANTGQDLDPAILASAGYPAVSSDFAASYDSAITNVAGLIGSITALYVQDKKGLLQTGSLVPRHFNSNELDFYGQDAWRIAPNLTITFGLRYSLLQPPYETDGNQVSPYPSLSSFFARRAAAMNAGQTYAPSISFSLGGGANGRPSYWNWDFKDIAPRLAVAYSPSANSGFWHDVFGAPGQTSIRGGFGIYYDHFGQGIVNTFDRQGSLGLTTSLQNPSYVSTTNCIVRFVSLTDIPNTNGCPVTPGGNPVPELPAPPAIGFPYTPPGAGANGSFAVGAGIDNALKTPYAYVFDFSITRELPGKFVLETAYVGRLGRRLLQEIDMAQPLNLRDPKSGMTYYQAAAALAALTQKNGGAGVPESSVAPIAFWENMFPGAAGPSGIQGHAPGIPKNPTATQNIYDLFFGINPSYISALQSLDTNCIPACSTLGPFAFFDPQFSTLYSWRSTGMSSYNALQVILRRHFNNVQFDFNYTYSKSIDLNSNAERVSEYELGSGSSQAIAYSGQTVNAWMPKQLRGPSDFDTAHQLSANWVLDLPFGRKHRWRAKSGFLDAVLGGWQLAGLARWTSGYPFSMATYAFATNYEQDSKATLIGPAPKTGVYPDANGDPNVFPTNFNFAGSFRYAYPGESGQRNNLRGPGIFDIDGSLAKTWKIAESHNLRFTWETYNVTNSVRFDIGSIDNYLSHIQSLGKYTRTLTKPRVMQFGLRYSF